MKRKLQLTEQEALARPRKAEYVSPEASERLVEAVAEYRKTADPSVSEVEALIALADTALSPELFMVLSQHSSHRVRRAVASSVFAPTDVLRLLISADLYGEVGVMENAVANPSLSVRDIEEMVSIAVSISDLWFISRIVSHPNLTRKALRVIVEFVSSLNAQQVDGFEELCREVKLSPLFPDVARVLLNEGGHGSREDFKVLPDQFPVRLWEALNPEWGRLERVFARRPHRK